MKVHSLSATSYECIYKDGTRALISFFRIVGVYKNGKYHTTNRWYSNITSGHIHDWVGTNETVPTTPRELEDMLP